jgi:hypothetical protein
VGELSPSANRLAGTSPTRLDITETFAAGARTIRKVWGCFMVFYGEELSPLIFRRDFISTGKLVETDLLGLQD